MNFISGLTSSTYGILFYFVLFLFCVRVCELLGISKRILSDKDVRFISRFWNLLHRFSEIMFAMSTTFHPQTN